MCLPVTGKEMWPLYLSGPVIEGVASLSARTCEVGVAYVFVRPSERGVAFVPHVVYPEVWMVELRQECWEVCQ